MKPVGLACALLLDMLRDGPRGASELLAAAECANISPRTMQRASQRLDILKTKEGQGGWCWRLRTEAAYVTGNDTATPPMEAPTALPVVTEAAIAARASVIADRLCKLEARRGKPSRISGMDPRVVRWAKAGLSDPDLREAYDRAVFVLGSPSMPVTVGFLKPFIDEVLREEKRPAFLYAGPGDTKAPVIQHEWMKSKMSPGKSEMSLGTNQDVTGTRDECPQGQKQKRSKAK